jgi:hypothetical protein
MVAKRAEDLYLSRQMGGGYISPFLLAHGHFHWFPYASLCFNCSTSLRYIAKSYPYFRSLQEDLPHMLARLVSKLPSLVRLH